MEIKNDGRLKICWMRIVGYQQFQDVFLDFTHPETGEPLDKICLIGANGTGKTVVLEAVNAILRGRDVANSALIDSFFVVLKLAFGSDHVFSIRGQHIQSVFKYSTKTEKLLREFRDFEDFLTFYQTEAKSLSIGDYHAPFLFDLLINSPCEDKENHYLSIEDVPKTTLAEAVLLKTEFPKYHQISSGSVDDFWRVLLYQCHIRREAQEAFELKDENLDRTKRELVSDFDSWNPKILEELGKKWDLILDKAGLEFDAVNAKIPYQPLENLRAYIVSKTTKEKIPYNRLSTGIRNYIFRLGHIYALYFQRNIQRGFLIVDEPENGLFPDFLYDLITVYRDIVGEKDTPSGQACTQMFFATHNPIIAAQFEPHERIILEWNDDGSVRTRRGVAPIGDDPNDVLRKDFAVTSLMGKEGLEAWNRYLELKRLLKTDEEAAKKEDIATAYLELGRLYGFPA